jgi:hypothetical protein
MEEGPAQLYPEPWEGLDPEDSPWEWDLVEEEENGATRNPRSRQPGWRRWYFTYHMPICTNVKISADRDPQSGSWFNPHPSTGQP